MQGLIARAGAGVIIATVLLSAGPSSGVVAQTLTNPNPNTPPPAVTKKSRAVGHVKNCSAYGPGFMAMPGSDICIKIGGGVTVEAGH